MLTTVWITGLIFGQFKLCTDIDREKNPGPSVYVDATKTIHAPYCQGNKTVFGENAGQQCVAMSLCALIYNKTTKIPSLDDMTTQIMIVDIQLYSSLSLLARQSMLMLRTLPGMVIVFEQFFHLECTVTVILVTSMVISQNWGVSLLYMPLGYSIWNTLRTELQLIHFNGGDYWCWYLQHWDWGCNVFDSHARDMYHNSHSEGTCIVGNTTHA